MAPQTTIPLAATVLGLIGTVFWSIQLIPQIWKSYRSKSTEGLPSTMMLLWGMSGLPFGAYAILQNFNIPLQIQPQFFALFCLTSWAQVKHYSDKWHTTKAALALAGLLVIVAGFQLLFVFVCRGPYVADNAAAAGFVRFLGIVACIMIIVGYVPIPPELLLRRGRVVGISLLFLSVDWLGAAFSLCSLVMQESFDITFGILYGLVVLIEGSVFVSQGVWLLRTRGLRARARAANLPFDDYEEAMEWQRQGSVDVTFPTLWKRAKALVLQKRQAKGPKV
ncbi:hypothetical protein SBRCBS47491_010093 [Sporothrix bragantina]|uniref:PQ loop repeat protein n=1 Tax=Sporothrix bragantina TaxID=671064 RepID=A0ABP0D0Z6_9PEZI